MPQLLKIRITYRALQNIDFPSYSGSTLRGVFGKSLRRVSCLSKQNTCEGCAARKTCPYAVLFENGNVSHGRNEEIPNPYVIEPMGTGQKTVRKDEEFSFNFLLFGSAIQKFSYVVLAWYKAGKLGFTCERAQAEPVKMEQILPDGRETLLYDFENSETETVAADSEYNMVPADEVVHMLRINLETPLRLRRDGHYITPAEFTAGDFLIPLIHRQQNLAKYYMNDYILPNFDAVKEIISGIKLDNADLHWFDWARYSSRQKKRIAMGGITGIFTLKGNIAPLYPYIKAGELFHTGKGAVFGLGKYRIIS